MSRRQRRLSAVRYLRTLRDLDRRHPVRVPFSIYGRLDGTAPMTSRQRLELKRVQRANHAAADALRGR